MTVGCGETGFVPVVIGLERLIVGACGMVISGLSGDNKVGHGLAAHGEGTLHNDWISTGE